MNIATCWAKNVVVVAAMLALVGPQTLCALPINTSPQNAMILVNDYWIDRHRNGGGLGPGNAVSHIGNLAMYGAFCVPQAMAPLTKEKCAAYFAYTQNWANRHGWQLNTASKEADNQAAGNS
jgi:hypothetical protein